MAFLKNLKTPEKFFLACISFIFTLLRIPSLVEPYWYGDEGIYQVIGMALRAGRVLYEGTWDNKPPILYLIYALVNGDQFWARFLSLIFGIGAVVAFYFLAKKLFTKPAVLYATTILFAVLFGIPLLEGNIANAENFMLFPTIMAMNFIFSAKQSYQLRYYIFAGLLLSFSFLIKIVAIFDVAAVFFISLILGIYDTQINKMRDVFSIPFFKTCVAIIKKELTVGVFFMLPIIITILYFVAIQKFEDFWMAAFSQNIGYVAYGNQFLIPNGLLYIKLIFLAFALLVIARFRKTLAPSGVFIFVWLAFSLYSAFFSERPYTHYLLVVLPAICLFVGYIFENKKIAKISGPLLVVILFLLWSNFHLYKKIVPYYENYISFIMNGKSVESYQSFFDRNTPRDYKLAHFIATKTSAHENVFIWGDSGQIYALAGKIPPGRYIVAYHITFYKQAVEETQRAIEKSNPKYIIVIKKGDEVDPLLTSYSLRYKIEDAYVYEK
jgi:hypothetical protein